LVAQICLLAIFAMAALRGKDPIELTERRSFAQKAATAALLTGVYDPVSLNWVYPETGLLTETVPYMRANRLSAFRGSSALLLEKPLESIFPLADSNQCSGALESLAPVDNSNGPGLGPGVRMLGWMWDRGQERLPSAIVVTTNGTVVGLGATSKGLPYARDANLALPQRYGGFVAYGPQLPSGSTANVYAILRRSPPSACYIGQIVR
jgi:hypothetical protein